MIKTGLKLFLLNRKVDESGVSGVGIVARGIIFESGKCAVEWVTEHQSIAIYDDVETLMAIHGHGGKTEIRIDDFDGMRRGIGNVAANLVQVVLEGGFAVSGQDRCRVAEEEANRLSGLLRGAA